MQPQKARKIDINSAYPCPCRRQGRLIPIALTEAFGCQRCQQIFVVKQEGHTIEQLSTSYAYKRTWFWNGHQWSTAPGPLGKNYWQLTLGLFFCILSLLLIGLPLVVQGLNPGVLLWASATVLLAVVPALIAWLALYSRR
ncbi:MAG TPA: hypothetical protein V6D03_02855 [Candidatus Caenarcaniphilales bacterium]